MSKYGFDPDELIETKVDLIDKDGFHGVGTADGGGNSGGGGSDGGNTNDSSKLHFSIETANGDNEAGVLIYLTKKDYPELFDNNSNITALYPYAYALYTGESVDTSEVDVDGESGAISLNNKPIGATLSSYNTLITKDFICYSGTFISDYSNVDIPEGIPLITPRDIAKGENVHVLLVYATNGSDPNDIYHRHFVQIDGVWTIDPSDFE